MNCRGEKV